MPERRSFDQFSIKNLVSGRKDALEMRQERNENRELSGRLDVREFSVQLNYFLKFSSAIMERYLVMSFLLR